MQSFVQAITTATEFLQARTRTKLDTMVVLGSGLGDLFDHQSAALNIDYADIPGLPDATAPSHAGHISFYNIKGHKLAVCHGRLHLYEGYSAREVSSLVYILNQLGADKLIITNAAGALNPNYQPGDIMVIEDHINFTARNPLLGQDESFGPLFPDMSQAYHAEAAAQALRIGTELNLPMHLGIYAGVLGPSLETSAERRMLHKLGTDAVGMSTVMEVIAANHCGMQTTGISAISNRATGDINQQPDSIEDVMHYAQIAGRGIGKIIRTIIDEQTRI